MICRATTALLTLTSTREKQNIRLRKSSIIGKPSGKHAPTQYPLLGILKKDNAPFATPQTEML